MAARGAVVDAAAAAQAVVVTAEARARAAAAWARATVAERVAAEQPLPTALED